MSAVDMHGLFSNSLFVTKYNGMRYVQGMQEFGGLIAAGLEIAMRVPGAISEVAGRFSLERAADAYRALEGSPSGAVISIFGEARGEEWRRGFGCYFFEADLIVEADEIRIRDAIAGAGIQPVRYDVQH